MATVRDQSQQIERLLSKDKEQSQELERLMSKVQFQAQQIETLKTATGTHASFVWKIPNVRAMLGRHKAAIRSEPFYLSPNGYKLRIIVNLSGPSVFQKVPQWSLYIRVVPGEFDDLLPWPIKEKVRVTLIDQNPCQDKRENISRVINFENAACPRPVTEDKGFDRGTLIDQKTLLARPHIMNDTMFIMANKEKDAD